MTRNDEVPQEVGEALARVDFGFPPDGITIRAHLTTLRAKLEAAEGEVARLREDARRLDWLADKDNRIGNVQLPTECVMRNLHSLRAAIDDAMALGGNANA